MAFVFDLYRVLRFASRLPLPELPRESDDPIVDANGFAPAFAASGFIIGLLGGLVALLVSLFGASPWVAAILVVATLVIVTGALHEDGLADFFDGVGGGRTRERKLEIMRDSHIGTYGVLALTLSVALRVACLAHLFSLSVWASVFVIIALQSSSRAFAMVTAARLPHARPDGAAARLGRPSTSASVLAIGIGVSPWILAAMCAALGLTAPFGYSFVLSSILVIFGMAIVTWLVMKMANSFLGGQTGDVLGANQQGCDLAGLVLLSISLSSAV